MMSYLAIITLRDPLHFVSILNKTETYMKKKNEKLSILNGKESANKMQSINLQVSPYCRGGENYFKILFSCFNFQLLIFFSCFKP